MGGSKRDLHTMISSDYSSVAAIAFALSRSVIQQIVAGDRESQDDDQENRLDKKIYGGGSASSMTLEDTIGRLGSVEGFFACTDDHYRLAYQHRGRELYFTGT